MAGTIDLAPRRAAGAAALAFALAFLTGCGGGSPTSTSSGVLSPTQTARGPSDLAANLAWLVAKHNRELKAFKADCPDEPTPPTYPVNCTMTAIDTSTRKHSDVPGGAHRPVSGTATILGVYPPTRTYAYNLQYAPVNSQ